MEHFQCDLGRCRANKSQIIGKYQRRVHCIQNGKSTRNFIVCSVVKEDILYKYNFCPYVAESADELT